MAIRTISINETEEKMIPADEMDESTGLLIHKYLSEKIDIEFPTAINDQNYVLRVKDGIGQMIIPDRLRIQLVPDTPLVNIFQMLEYTYKINASQYLDSIFCLDSLNDLFNKVARDLSIRVHERIKKGLYQDYITKVENMTYLRGRLDQTETMKNFMKGDTKLTCEYQEHTPDIIHNQILLWTLFKISSFGMKEKEIIKEIRKAYHVLRNTITMEKLSSNDCIGLDYNRLNEDYRYMHRICQFFLDQITNENDESRTYIPITLSMRTLFRSFVAEWIRSNLPKDLGLRIKEKVEIEPHWKLRDELDIILYDSDTYKPIYLISTIYGHGKREIADDIYRAAALGVKKGCKEMVLIYPRLIDHSIDTFVGDIRVRAIPFPLDGDMNKSGRKMLESLFRTHNKRIVIHGESNLFTDNKGNEKQKTATEDGIYRS